MAEKKYIEQEAIEKIICDICETKLLCCPSRDFTDCEPKELLKAIPNADVVEIRHGHWESLYWAFDYYRCSECGFEQKLEEFPYCPNCGAKMDEESGEDDSNCGRKFIPNNE